MHYCLIYNLKSSSGKKVKLVNKIYEKLKIDNTVDYFKTKSEEEAKDIFLKFIPSCKFLIRGITTNGKYDNLVPNRIPVKKNPINKLLSLVWGKIKK